MLSGNIKHSMEKEIASCFHMVFTLTQEKSVLVFTNVAQTLHRYACPPGLHRQGLVTLALLSTKVNNPAPTRSEHVQKLTREAFKTHTSRCLVPYLVAQRILLGRREAAAALSLCILCFPLLASQ